MPSWGSDGSGNRGRHPPAETVRLPGRARVGNPSVPTWVASRQQGVNLLSVGKASRTLLPACVCSGPGSSETETSKTPGPASPQGILSGFTFYGEVPEVWAEPSPESGQGRRRGGLAPLLLRSSSHPRPAPRCQGPVLDLGKHAGGQAGVARCQSCSSPPLRHWEIPKPLSFSPLPPHCNLGVNNV